MSLVPAARSSLPGHPRTLGLPVVSGLARERTPEASTCRSGGTVHMHRGMNQNERLARHVLLFGVMPTWVVAGTVDWWCHRRTRIEENAGLPEALSHMVMIAEAGVPAVLALFLEVDPPLLALSWAATAAHELTASWDLAYAAPRRPLPVTEQHAHSFLEVLPIATSAILSVLHPRAVKGLARGELRGWRLRPRRHPLHPVFRLGLLVAIGLLQGVTHVEEVVRCVRAANRRRSESRGSFTGVGSRGEQPASGGEPTPGTSERTVGPPVGA